jgi:PAS domain S-box-containing protein
MQGGCFDLMNEVEDARKADLLITGSSEMAARMRAHDWSRTPLGPWEQWPETLLASVNLMLQSPFPTVLCWGEDLVFLYNDEAIATLSDKHPAALGGFYREVFREAWDLVGEDMEACLLEGRTAVRDNMLIPILRHGVMEDQYWSYSLIPVYENGRIRGVYDAFRNMTETVEATRKLRESEARLKIATEAAQLGVFVWDTGTDQAVWENERLFEIFGRAPEQGPVGGEEFLRSFLLPDFHDAFKKNVAQTMEHGAPLHFEGLMYRADGTLRSIEIRGDLHREAGGMKAKVLGTVRDITELRQAEKTLRDSAKRLGQLAAIVSSSDDVIVSKDLDGTITTWNEAATRVFGYTAEEMIGTSILRLIPDHLQSDEQVILKSIREGQQVQHFETVRKTRDGRLIDVSLTISPLKDATGKVVGASKILRDISDRRRMEQSLLQAEKIAATGRMAATIAHEINNPLEAVMNLLYLLRPKIVDEEGQAYLASAESELNRVSHIAKQTLGYYREHASARLSSVQTIAEQALSIYEPRCMAAGITMERDFRSSRKIVLRQGETMQVISNLITNAIYAMPYGGRLKVSVFDTESPADGVALVVADTGIGIPQEMIPKVFEAFFTMRPSVGTGIGLFVAKQFVEGHGGQMEITSRTEGEQRGTEVCVFLPVHTTYEDAEVA